MTNAQIKALVKILHKAEDLSFKEGEYEIKEYRVEELKDTGMLSVVMVVGRKDDEGSVASYICRDRVHLFVGKRGGIKYFTKNLKFKPLKHNQSLFTVCMQS